MFQFPGSDNFSEIFRVKVELEIISKEKSQSEYYQQLSFKSFENSLSIPKWIPKFHISWREFPTDSLVLMG